MARNIHSNYYEDNYVKYECQDCKRSFIIGERLSANMDLSCPYCKSLNIESTVATDEEKTEELDMGCLGIYFHVYDDGNLMLYTENEFYQAMKEFFNNSSLKEIALGGHNQILKDYCTKRDMA